MTFRCIKYFKNLFACFFHKNLKVHFSNYFKFYFFVYKEYEKKKTLKQGALK